MFWSLWDSHSFHGWKTEGYNFSSSNFNCHLIVNEISVTGLLDTESKFEL